MTGVLFSRSTQAATDRRSAPTVSTFERSNIVPRWECMEYSVRFRRGRMALLPVSSPLRFPVTSHTGWVPREAVVACGHGRPFRAGVRFCRCAFSENKCCGFNLI